MEPMDHTPERAGRQVVLDVGQCSYDHGKIGHLLESLGLTVERAHSIPEAIAMIRRNDFQLVLVNRILDRDRSEGLELIRLIRNDPDLETLPVMLVSDLPEAQAMAREEGAREGFGKKALMDPMTGVRIKKALSGG